MRRFVLSGLPVVLGFILVSVILHVQCRAEWLPSVSVSDDPAYKNLPSTNH